ncbi:MAG: glycosyltransferase family 2 protein [Flavisolibacter sp.]|nr:glycosyltransferase family 2 protein [Flavisolibacter sp.]
MIILYHNRYHVARVHDVSLNKAVTFSVVGLTDALFNLAAEYPDRMLLWCEMSLEQQFNFSAIPEIFHHKKMLATYSPGEDYLSDVIGYIDESAFIKINKNVSFPTWRMSSAVGGIAAALLLALEKHLVKEQNFDYFLNSTAKLAMPLGLFCYSEPALLKSRANIQSPQASKRDLFRFARQHYKPIWPLLLFINLFIYEKKFPILPFLLSLFNRRRKLSRKALDTFSILSEKINHKRKTIDVLIPTIGRKQELLNVLEDLAGQTLLPQQVIIAEQNPVSGSTSELDYLVNRSWPFKIRHIFTHQPGACNARNLALEEVRSDWIFFADDDIRIEKNFFEQAFSRMYQINGDIFNLAILNPGEKKKYEGIHLTAIFGAGCSIVSRESISNSRFDMAFEFGYGEDHAFGRHLMNKGYVIAYIPDPVINHLKSPSGGFRTRPKLLWDDDIIKPKPSPTTLLFRMQHLTREQLNGYRTVSFFKYYKNQKVKNPIRYYKIFKRQWNRSMYWANKLAESRNVEQSSS